MAHIVSCMLESQGTAPGSKPTSYRPQGLSHKPSNDSILDKSSVHDYGGALSSKMSQKDKGKYRLFPQEKHPSTSPRKATDPDQAGGAPASGRLSSDGADGPSPMNGLRTRMHSITRHRKISVSAAAAAAAAAPGGSPLHGRSISAPGNSWRQRHPHDPAATGEARGDAQIAQTRGDMVDAKAARVLGLDINVPPPLRSLPPLLITAATSGTTPHMSTKSSANRLRSDSTPVGTVRPAQAEDSPKSQAPPTSSPASTTVLTPSSVATTATSLSTAPTPPLPVPTGFQTSAAEPWGGRADHAITTAKKLAIGSTWTANAPPESPIVASMLRTQSGPEPSIMERGRPRKRAATSSAITSNRGAPPKSASTDLRAPERLPQDWKVNEAANMPGPAGADVLQRQAVQHAPRLDMLDKGTVQDLSRELQQLDERSEYLRRAHTSLRAERRNLHLNICQNLRSIQSKQTSYDAVMNQEEALTELDACIDVWWKQLEQTEDRRTRIHHRLLEHVVAAAASPTPRGLASGVENQHPFKDSHTPECVRAADLSTPPDSPSKASFSSSCSPSPSLTPPQRVVPKYPSTILENPAIEEAANAGFDLTGGSEGDAPPPRAETILVYADTDVSALLAEVEDQIGRMGAPSHGEEARLSDDERRVLHRARSERLLSGGRPKTATNTRPSSSRSTRLNPRPSTAAAAHGTMLTDAVFRPGESVMIL